MMSETLASNWHLLAILFAPWVLLALVSAFTDAGVGFIDEWLLKKIKQESSDAVDAPGRLILISGFFGLIISLGVLLFSGLTSANYYIVFDSSSLWMAVAAGMLEVLWLIPYFYALDNGGAINTTPLFQTVPIFALLLGLLFFNEVPIMAHIIAAGFIVLGAILLNYSPDLRQLNQKTIFLMLFSSTIISLGYFIFKDAALEANMLTAVFGSGLGMVFLSTLIWTGWKPYRLQFNSFIKTISPRVLLMQFGNEGLYAFSTLTNQLALVIGPSVMAVSALNAFHPIFTLLIGGTLAWFGSNDHQQQLQGKLIIYKTIAITSIVIGTLLITVY